MRKKRLQVFHIENSSGAIAYDKGILAQRISSMTGYEWEDRRPVVELEVRPLQVHGGSFFGMRKASHQWQKDR